ncbi:MAG: O-antigen ligase family protein [Gemmatimonadaceae bacterium]
MRRRALRAGVSAAAPAESSLAPWRGVQWTLAYVGFLVYVFVITTYRFNIGTVAMGAALLGLPLQRGTLRFPSLVVWSGVFLVWSFFGFSQSRYPGIVWEHLIDFAKIWLITLTAANVIRTRAQLRFFLLFFLGCFALYPVRGALFNYFVYRESMEGRAYWKMIYANPNDIAAFCLLQLSLAIGVLLTDRRGWARKAALAGILVLPFLVLLTQSRGAFIALVVFALFALGAQRRRKRVRAIATVLVVGAIVAVAAPESAWKRLGGIANFTAGGQVDLYRMDREGSAAQRYEIWKVALAIIRDQPLFGVGLGAYPLAHQAYATRPDFDKMARGKRDAHSTYLSIFAETGIVGLVLFLVVLLVTVRDAERVRRRCRQLLPAESAQLLYLEIGLLAYLIAGLFGNYGRVVFTYLHLALIYVTAHLMIEQFRTLRLSEHVPVVPPPTMGAPVGLPAARARRAAY